MSDEYMNDRDLAAILRTPGRRRRGGHRRTLHVLLADQRPRVAGTATIVMNETDYREGRRRWRARGIGKMGTALLRVVNDAGTWEGPRTALQLENPEAIGITGWLAGSDAYEALDAYAVWSMLTTDPGRDLWGHITSEGPPPAPESLPE